MIKILSSKEFNRMRDKCIRFDEFDLIARREVTKFELMSENKKDLVLKRLVYANQCIIELTEENKRLEGLLSKYESGTLSRFKFEHVKEPDRRLRMSN